ncbi:TIGR03086 family protein [Catellatospora methionotrophica]|uniref:TIGR03086 family protein n=1 Tax=Catellatospora methionotrophica TaxID=121620 RepID=A0A8J3PF45_9ACTN|nr:TIGR03086 family metal-binding protein [Catellatospora methionotrophica]GIG15286.1 TIGR03086 family protein [Catellatospora methionotrophica]
MTTISKLLRESADVALPVLHGITDEQLATATPCAEFQVGDLVNHLFQVVVNFQGLARREAADFSGTPDVLGTDWRARFVDETRELIAAWSDDAALEGISPGMGLPQPTVGRMALLDLTLHPWDLAVATGQRYTPSHAAVEELLLMVEQMGPMAREWKVFGEPVPTAPDADPFTRLLGATGRDPGWRPAP